MFEKLTAALLARDEGWTNGRPGFLSRDVAGELELVVDVGIIGGRIAIALSGDPGDEMYELVSPTVLTLLPEIDDYIKRYLGGSL